MHWGMRAFTLLMVGLALPALGGEDVVNRGDLESYVNSGCLEENGPAPCGGVKSVDVLGTGILDGRKAQILRVRVRGESRRARGNSGCYVMLWSPKGSFPEIDVSSAIRTADDCDLATIDHECSYLQSKRGCLPDALKSFGKAARDNGYVGRLPEI